MPLPPPLLLLPFESPLCPAEISRGAASSWSLASLDVVATLKQSQNATLRRCRVPARGGGREVVVKSLPRPSPPPPPSSSSPLAPPDAALAEASAHAAAFHAAPDAVLPFYAAFKSGSEKSEGGAPPPPPPPPSSQMLHLVLAAAAGTARDAAAGSGGFLLEEHAAAAALSALKGCAALHSMGLVHGDVKPENLLVLPRLENRSEGGGGGEEDEVSSSSSSSPSPASLSFSFALSDFGSACPIGGPFPLGTLDFLPPEALLAGREGSGGLRGSDSGSHQFSCPFSSSPPLSSFSAAASAAASPAADVWAIGATTVDLLTGAPPFAASARGRARGAAAAPTPLAAAAAAAAAREGGEGALRLPRHLSREAASFCELCLAKRASERPSCLELLCGHEWFRR